MNEQDYILIHVDYCLSNKGIVCRGCAVNSSNARHLKFGRSTSSNGLVNLFQAAIPCGVNSKLCKLVQYLVSLESSHNNCLRVFGLLCVLVTLKYLMIVSRSIIGF